MAKGWQLGKSPRQEAIRKGERNYLSGRPCPRGHIGMRRVSGACLECMRLSRPEANKRRLEKDPLIFSFNDAKKRAKKLGLNFNISKEDIATPTHCPLLGLKLVYGHTGKRQDNSASLDRIDNSKGYIKGNVWVISDRANRLKRDTSFDDFEKIYKAWKKLNPAA